MSAGVTRCPACGAGGVEPVYHQDGVPVNSCLLLDDPVEARSFPRGQLSLAFCDGCGFLTNTAFDPSLAEYSARYEETQGFSDRFTQFARNLAKRWVATHELYGKHVLEIGCGKGEFLVMMLEEGAGTGAGIDPGVHPERIASDAGRRATWIADFYSEAYLHLSADAVVCRHTLEHIHPVAGFMDMLRGNLSDRTETVVLFEVPDVLRVLREAAFWDVYYEHCSYFSAGSLARLFRASGFEVLDVALDYDDQYVLLEALPAAGASSPASIAVEDDLPALRAGVEHFAAATTKQVASWREQVDALHGRGGRAVIWGAGSKGVTFLTSLGIGDEIPYAVDINPFKHGKFMAGTGQEIVAPAFLRHYRPDLVIAMNPVYLDEIRDQLDLMGIAAELTAV